MRFFLYRYRKPVLITLAILLILGLAAGLLAFWIGQLQQDHLIRTIREKIPSDYFHADFMTQPIMRYVVEGGKQPYRSPSGLYDVFFFDDDQCIGVMTCGYLTDGNFHVQYTWPAESIYSGYEKYSLLEEAVAAGQPVGFYYTHYGDIIYTQGKLDMDGDTANYANAAELLYWPAFFGIGMYHIELIPLT